MWSMKRKNWMSFPTAAKLGAIGLMLAVMFLCAWSHSFSSPRTISSDQYSKDSEKMTLMEKRLDKVGLPFVRTKDNDPSPSAFICFSSPSPFSPSPFSPACALGDGRSIRWDSFNIEFPVVSRDSVSVSPI